jgi:fructose-1,6-bisphosphatase/sedoheptulose 1,7-bisphosphatase-like protein
VAAGGGELDGARQKRAAASRHQVDIVVLSGVVVIGDGEEIEACLLCGGRGGGYGPRAVAVEGVGMEVAAESPGRRGLAGC